RGLGNGGHEVEDVTAVPTGHLVDGTLGKPEEPGQVDPDDRRVVGRGVVGERLGDQHASVVDQGVDAAEASQGCIDDLLGGSALGNVRGDGDQIGVLRRLDRTGARHHPPALPPIPGDKPGADTLRASRDDSDLARHDAGGPESTGAGKAYFDIAGTPNSAGRVRTITVAPRATDCACEVPGRVPWSATSRWRRRAGGGPCPSCRAPGRPDGHAGDEGSDERGGHGRLPAGRGREGRRDGRQRARAGGLPTCSWWAA